MQKPENEWADEYLQQIEDCEARESRLSDWDRGFLDSIKAQLTQRSPRPLSVKQIDKLDEIFERATKKG